MQSNETAPKVGSPPESSHPFALITPSKVLDIVESTGLVSDLRQLVLNSYENRVYQVGIEEQTPVILKVYRPDRWSDAQILEEHQFTQELHDAELSVVAPLMLNGQTLHTFDIAPDFSDIATDLSDMAPDFSDTATNAFHFQHDSSNVHTDSSAAKSDSPKGQPTAAIRFRFALFPRQGGHAPELDQEDTLVTLGRTLACWHNQGAVKPFKDRPELTIERFGQASREFLLANDFIPQELIPAYESLTQELLDIISSRWLRELSSIRLHGDCHPGNILWRDKPHFVDLDDALMGPEIQDLWMLIPQDDQSSQQAWQLLLEGYNDFRPFDLSQMALIEPLRTLRLMHYSAWLARRWQDPAFKAAFPWFDSIRYWSDHILSLREQRSALDEPPPQIWL